MKLKLLPVSIGALAIGIAACTGDYLEFDKFEAAYTPTVAAPIARLSISVDDVLKRWESDIIKFHDPAVDPGDADSAFFLTLVYKDTLEPLSYPSGAPVSPITVNLPQEDVLLRIFGNLDDGDFRFVNPSVRFTLDNQTDIPFLLAFRDGAGGDLFTSRVGPGNVPIETTKREIEIIDPTHPYDIVVNGETTFTLDNDNIRYVDDPNDDKPMSSVIEPVPKKLYYGLDVKPTITGTTTGGDVNVYADVILPLEGYGNITFYDTATYEFFEAGDTIDFVKFIELRLIIDNGIPMEASVSGTLYDSTTTPWTALMALPLYSHDMASGSSTLDPERMVVGPADPGVDPSWETTPTQEISDIILTKDETVTFTDHSLGGSQNSLTQVEAFARGNKMIINANIQTAGAEGGTVSKLYSHYSMDIILGVRASVGLDLNDVLN